MSTSTISVPNELKQQLNELKIHSKESYADVITRLIICAEDPIPLSDEEIEGIKEALDDIKAGRVKSADQLRYELGL